MFFQEEKEQEEEAPTEQLSIEMTNETSNDSNKENQPQSPDTVNTEKQGDVVTEEQQQTAEVATVENRPISPPTSPGK